MVLNAPFPGLCLPFTFMTAVFLILVAAVLFPGYHCQFIKDH